MKDLKVAAKLKALGSLVKQMQHLIVQGKGDQTMKPDVVKDAVAEAADGAAQDDEDLLDHGADEEAEGDACEGDKEPTIKDDVKAFFHKKPKPKETGTRVMIGFGQIGSKAAPTAHKPPVMPKQQGRRGR